MFFFPGVPWVLSRLPRVVIAGSRAGLWLFRKDTSHIENLKCKMIGLGSGNWFKCRDSKLNCRHYR